MKWLLTMFLVGCASAQALPSAPVDRTEATFAQTVALTDEHGVFCSGTVLESGKVLTAAHCVELDQVVQVGFYRDWVPGAAEHSRTFRFGVFRDQDDVDLALLEPLGPVDATYVGARLAPAAPRAGDPAFQIGHPLGLGYTFAQGYIAAAHRLPLGDGGFEWVQADVPGGGGSSGAALLNVYGEITGVRHGTMLDHRGVPLGHLSIFVHLSEIQRFLGDSHAVPH